MRRLTLALTLLAAPALLLAGCGDSTSTSNRSTTKKASGSNAGAATVAAGETGLGTILVDSTGHTLYIFEKDKGEKSTCLGACASTWRPLTTSSKPTPGSGVSAAMLGTSARPDGTTEVTYNGHPLYTYAGDAGPGDTSGEGLEQFGAQWYALSPQGAKVETHY